MDARDISRNHAGALALTAGFCPAILLGPVASCPPFWCAVGVALVALGGVLAGKGRWEGPARRWGLVALAGLGLVLAGQTQWRCAAGVQAVLAADLGRVAWVEGRVSGDAAVDGEGDFDFPLAVERWGLASGAVVGRPCQARIRATGSGAALRSGARVRVVVSAARDATGSLPALRLSGKLAVLALPAGADAVRAAALDGIEGALARLGEPSRGLAVALLVGRTDRLDPYVEAVYRQSGCAHLVALSGMHVALAAGLLVAAVRPSGGVRAARLAGLAGAAALVWLVGPFPSALRALAMFAVYQAAALLGRRVSLMACLALSGPLIGLAAPELCHSLGFQLSFAALFGILLVQEAWTKLMAPSLRPVLAGELAGGMSAQFATLPVLAVHGLPVALQGFLAGAVLGLPTLLFLALSLAAVVAAPCAPLFDWLLIPVIETLCRILVAIGGCFLA